MAADGHLNFDTRIDESGFNSGIGKLTGLATKGFTAICAAGVAAFAGLTVASLKAVADLEQNIGGVETLFKDSAADVVKNANEAFKTAGMSANEYMSTVTSFSASLLQSLGGDTKKAAEYADRAIIDMADNANKMGTSMELIQNAYQGFAKQNYTMLDNLKLGYGGTQEEMKRLIKDAAALKDVQEDLGVTVDENSMSFGNIVNAISVMQAEMGIAGTTSAEAADTIAGSIAAMQAAWDNFLAGTGSAEQFAESLGVAAGNIIANLMEIVPRLASEIPTLVKSAYKQIGKAFKENAPMLANYGSEVIESVISSTDTKEQHLLSVANNIIDAVISGIESKVPQLLNAGSKIIASIGNGLSKVLPELVPRAMEMIVTLADAIISNMPTLINTGIAILQGLLQGIVSSIPLIITEGPRIINEFANAVYAGLGQLLQLGWQIITSLASGIWENRGLIAENAGQIFLAIVNAFSLSKMLSLGKSLITNAVKGIKSMVGAAKASGADILKSIVNGIKSLATHPVTTLKDIATKAMNAFKNVNWGHVGSNIISGIISGLKAAAGRLLTEMGSLAKRALEAAKEKLGIHSPSRVFRDQVGKMMALGIGVGFEKNLPIKSMNNSLQNALNSVKRDVALTTSYRNKGTKGLGGGDDNRAFTGDTSITQNVHIHQPVKSPVETARALRRAGRELAYA